MMHCVSSVSPSHFLCFSALWFHCRGWLRGAGQVTLRVWQVRWINTWTGETFPLQLEGLLETRPQGPGFIFALKYQHLTPQGACFFALQIWINCSHWCFQLCFFFISDIVLHFLVGDSSEQCFHGCFREMRVRKTSMVMTFHCKTFNVIADFSKRFQLKGLKSYLLLPEWHIDTFSGRRNSVLIVRR